jgi:hypothetical protein
LQGLVGGIHAMIDVNLFGRAEALDADTLQLIEQYSEALGYWRQRCLGKKTLELSAQARLQFIVERRLLSNRDLLIFHFSPIEQLEDGWVILEREWRHPFSPQRCRLCGVPKISFGTGTVAETFQNTAPVPQ